MKNKTLYYAGSHEQCKFAFLNSLPLTGQSYSILRERGKTCSSSDPKRIKLSYLEFKFYPNIRGLYDSSLHEIILGSYLSEVKYLRKPKTLSASVLHL